MFNVGHIFGYPAEDEIDVCTNYVNGSSEHCSTAAGGYGPCGHGGGDCDSNSECDTFLYCKSNVGAQFGMPSDYDVCVWTWE